MAKRFEATVVGGMRMSGLIDYHQTPSGSIARVTLRGEEVPHYHKKQDKTYFVISGRGAVQLDGRQLDIYPGSVVIIPRNTRHRFLPNNSLYDVLVISSPKLIPNDLHQDTPF